MLQGQRLIQKASHSSFIVDIVEKMTRKDNHKFKYSTLFGHIALYVKRHFYEGCSTCASQGAGYPL